MKLKINKACDLSSISVLPPQSRRLTGAPSSQLRSQPSQQSFSQGFSSQHGMFSQLSQSSLDDSLINDQRFNSQDQENSAKKTSCLSMVNYTQEESQMPILRSSANIMRKWNPASLPNKKCQLSEELEHRVGMMENLLNKFGMILDSIQSDVMQVNKGTKEVLMELERMQQRLNTLDSSLQTMYKGQEEIKLNFDGSLRSMSEKLSKDIFQDTLQQILLMLSALPEQMKASLLKLQNELHTTFTKEVQTMTCSLRAVSQRSPSITMLPPKGMTCSLRTLSQKSPSVTVLPSKVTGSSSITPKKAEPLKNPAVPLNVCRQPTAVPKVEMGGWKSVKMGQTKFRASHEEHKHKEGSSLQERMKQDRQSRVIIESDEEIDGGFSCLIDEKETGTGNYMFEEAKEETERILRKARRRKRKYCNHIIIN